ncbi:MAG: PAS domain S-box protein [Candidatus Obscuribacterales bacterium]|nr:PAS domain S-box protein [Candidatus Obscuribacterales bacterium]
MSLSNRAKLIAGITILIQFVTFCFLASALAQSHASSTIDDPLRAFIFLSSFAGLLIIGLLYFFFEIFVIERLNFLSQEKWLQSNQNLPWMTASPEFSGISNALKQLYSRNSESAERENLIADHALDLICSLSTKRVLLAINPASLAQIGYAPVSLIGRALDKLCMEEDTLRLEQALEKARSEQSPVQLDLVLKTMQGVLKDFRWTVEWSESAGLYYCVARDISSEKQLERVKQEFFSMVSHDLRTPITSVRAFMTHLEEGGPYGTLTEKGKRHLSGVEDNLDRMIRLTTDLLDLDKLEAGSMQLEQAVIKVKDLIEHSVNSVRQLAEQKRVSINVQDSELEAYGDIHRLTQVLVNLLSNAIKFSPEDSTIEVNVETLRHQIAISVVDHGRGIPQSMLDIIFERYKQVDVSDHKVKKGSGLGLAIAKALIDAHHGQIGVKSEEGKGTSFWIRINKARK